MAVSPQYVRMTWFVSQSAQPPCFWVWQRYSDGSISLTSYAPPGRDGVRVIVITGSMDIAMRVASRAREVLPEGPQSNPNRPTQAVRKRPITVSEKPSQSVRTVSGGLPTLGKRR